MVIEGKIDVGVPPEVLWDFLLDLARFSACIPGVESVSQVSAEKFTGVIRARVGPAGCVVAARLSEDPSRTVLLLEAGPDPDPIPDAILDPRRAYEMLLGGHYVDMLPVERDADGSRRYLLAGRIMGGGSSVNIT